MYESDRLNTTFNFLEFENQKNYQAGMDPMEEIGGSSSSIQDISSEESVLMTELWY